MAETPLKLEIQLSSLIERNVQNTVSEIAQLLRGSLAGLRAELTRKRRQNQTLSAELRQLEESLRAERRQLCPASPAGERSSKEPSRSSEGAGEGCAVEDGGGVPEPEEGPRTRHDRGPARAPDKEGVRSQGRSQRDDSGASFYVIEIDPSAIDLQFVLPSPVVPAEPLGSEHGSTDGDPGDLLRISHAGSPRVNGHLELEPGGTPPGLPEPPAGARAPCGGDSQPPWLSGDADLAAGVLSQAEGPADGWCAWTAERASVCSSPCDECQAGAPEGDGVPLFGSQPSDQKPETPESDTAAPDEQDELFAGGEEPQRFSRTPVPHAQTGPGQTLPPGHSASGSEPPTPAQSPGFQMELRRSKESPSLHGGPLTQEPAAGYHCPHCGKKLSSSYSVRRHLQIHMRDRFRCAECGKTFGYLSSLDRHKRIHSRPDEPPGKICGPPAGHVRRLRRRRGRNPLGCIHCEEPASRRNSLPPHRAAQHPKRRRPAEPPVPQKDAEAGGKPRFPCGQCHKSFTRRYSLKRHLSAHTAHGPPPAPGRTQELGQGGERSRR
ncbi:zinc finger protein 696 isoform X1 [Lepisosteus oculatus]|uniref:zinc finger protein 696 isoform X1 n=1 Tax=Lepisosteus oculatus TaxID=7918 RepID=UPI00371AB4C4